MDPRELPTIQNTLEDDALHDEWDAQVNQDSEIEEIPSGKSLRPFMASGLLDAIINHSDGRLDKSNLGDKGYGLISKNPLLLEKLREAWVIKKYRSIRLLAILQAPAPPTEMSDDQREQLTESFRAPFLGAAVDGLFEFLETNEQSFRSATQQDPYYAKFCSIVQSSGTGKSRVLTELSEKNVVVLYINLREAAEKTGFPLRDPIPCKILESQGSKNQYRNVCYAFMAALFETLEEVLSAAAERDPHNAVQYWRETMCDMNLSKAAVREQFFTTVETKYARWLKYYNLPSNPDIDETTEKLRTLSLSDSQNEPPGTNSFQRPFIEAYAKLGDCLQKIIEGDPTRPRLVIAIDEAHPLSRPQSLPPAPGYRPADILTGVINRYSHSQNQHAIWVVFASTTSRVADFSPPNEHHDSIRIAVHGQRLFRPYTQLGWDHHAQASGTPKVNDIAKISHILRYGRPLWKSLVATVDDPKGMLLIASKKLFGGTSFNHEDTGHVLAAFGQRFALEVTLGHPDSVQALQTAVASHLRICLATTLDRTWSFTSYPSEPLLSCVAASALHSSPSRLTIALGKLEAKMRQGMINIGERGELTSRFLWLLAKDLYVRKQVEHSKEGLVTRDGEPWEQELLDCKMIPVVGWLEFVFGERVFGGSDEERQRVRAYFADACINFSHWISMDSDLSGASDDLPLDQLTFRHWQRTSAVQCAPQQPCIDKMIPVYFKDADHPVPTPDRMSQIFISDKARRSSSKKTLQYITRRHKLLGGYSKERARNGRPYIAILADLGLPKSQLHTSFPDRDTADHCLRIYAAGLDVETYPFLKGYPGLLSALQKIVHVQKPPKNNLPYGNYLDAQVMFGSTATAEHMKWEHGREAPPQSTGGPEAETEGEESEYEPESEGSEYEPESEESDDLTG